MTKALNQTDKKNSLSCPLFCYFYKGKDDYCLQYLKFVLLNKRTKSNKRTNGHEQLSTRMNNNEQKNKIDFPK